MGVSALVDGGTRYCQRCWASFRSYGTWGVMCTLHRAPVGQGASGHGWPLPLDFGLDGRLLLLATGTAWADLGLTHHHIIIIITWGVMARLRLDQ